MPLTPPEAVAVEVVATQPTAADEARIARLSQAAGRDMAPVAYIVKVRLQTMPPATSAGWALYINDFRIPKYWQYKDGIYFKIYDRKFLEDHAGEPLRFSPNGTEFIETRLSLASLDALPLATDVQHLPSQADILNGPDSS